MDADECELDVAAEAEKLIASGDIRTAMAVYERANHRRRRPEFETELVKLRALAFSALGPSTSAPAAVDRSLAPPIDSSVGLPVVHGLPSAACLRAAIETHGSLLVRGLLTGESVGRLLAAVKRAIAARDGALAGRSPPDGRDWASEFPALKDSMARALAVEQGMLVADSPRGLFVLLDELGRAGVDALLREYHGGSVALACEKLLFRAVEPHRLPADFPYGWHQDGSFLGRHVRALDLWITLTPAGRDAPGLEVLPRRVDRILTGGGMFDWDLSTPIIEKEFPGFRSSLPDLSPGDAVFIDHLTVHRAGQTPSMTRTRYGIECWTFAADGFPTQYAGLAL